MVTHYVLLVIANQSHCVQVEDSWKALEFVVLPHRDSKDVFILGGTDDIQVGRLFRSALPTKVFF